MELQMRNTKMKLPKGIRKSERRLTRMMLFIFGVFFVTYMPGVVVKMVINYNCTNATFDRMDFDSRSSSNLL